MAQVLHSRATTTPRIRAEIQSLQELRAALTCRLSINPKTVSKCRHRVSVEDVPVGPKERCSRWTFIITSTMS